MVVLVSGLPGSGKSYFAKRLAQRLGSRYISSDSVRKSMQASGKYTLHDKLAVYNEMAKVLDQFLTQAKNVVVVDATFYLKTARILLHNVAANHLANIYNIQITADESLIKDRLTKPREDSEADFEVYKLVKEQYETVDVPHLTLQSTNNNIYEMLTEAMEYIKE